MPEEQSLEKRAAGGRRGEGMAPCPADCPAVLEGSLPSRICALLSQRRGPTWLGCSSPTGQGRKRLLSERRPSKAPGPSLEARQAGKGATISPEPKPNAALSHAGSVKPNRLSVGPSGQLFAQGHRAGSHLLLDSSRSVQPPPGTGFWFVFNGKGIAHWKYETNTCGFLLGPARGAWSALIGSCSHGS